MFHVVAWPPFIYFLPTLQPKMRLWRGRVRDDSGGPAPYNVILSLIEV
jgi:hypothetical protein